MKQDRMQQLTLGFQGMGYKERLDSLALFSPLECNKLRDDFIEVYKIMRSINSLSLFSRVGESKI